MEVNLYSVGGKSKGKVTLPAAFESPVRVDLIRKTVNAARANRRQAYGPNARAGMRHAASTWGKGRGVSRVQRMKQGSTAVESPNNVGGRRAHPPRPEHDWSEKVNRKERQAAFRSALAATAQSAIVRQRGHRFNEELTLPLILEAAAEDPSGWLKSCYRHLKINDPPEFTRKGLLVTRDLGIEEDLDRAKNGRHVRAGRGKLRGRRFRTPRSALVVISELNGTERAFENLPGFQVTTSAQLNTEDLAPGGDPGRLTIFTEQGLKALNQRLDPQPEGGEL